MKKIVFLIMFSYYALYAGGVRPIFNPFTTIDWNFFADNFEWKTKLCSCELGDSGLQQAGFELSFFEPIAIVDVTSTPWDFPSIGIKLDSSLGRKQGTDHESKSGAKSFRYTHFIIYPIFGIFNLVTDYVCFEKLSVLTFGFMSEINPSWNNDTLASFMHPEKLLYALAAPACIADCASSTAYSSMNSLYFCAGCWPPLATNTGNTPGQNPMTEAGTLITRLLDDMHKTYALTKTSNASFGMTNTNIPLKNSVCNETYFPIVIKTQYRIQQGYPVTWDAIRIGQMGLKWSQFKMGKDKEDDMAFWIWRKRDECMGAYKCKSTFAGMSL